MKIEAKFDREKVWYRGDSVRHLVVSVTDPGGEHSQPAVALNLALVVDASGSMAGEPIEFAITAAQRIIDQLSDRDRLSIVSFHSAVTDHLVAEPMTPAGRTRALRSLASIQANGNTNLSAGWLRGAEHVAKGMESGPRWQHRVIILSDGHANEGIVDPAALATHAKELALRQLFTSSIGIGDNYNSQTLEAIAVHGGGNHHRAAQPHEIVEVVTAELKDIRLTAAENIQVSIQHAPGVRIKCLNEFPLTHEDDLSFCNLGSLTAGGSRSAIFRVKFPSGDIGATCRFQIRTTWRRPGAEDVYASDPFTLDVRFAGGPENNAQPHDSSLVETVAPVWQAYIVRRIVSLNREGRYSEAIKRLDRDLPLFSKYAKNAANGATLILELKQLRQVAHEEWNEGNRKEVEVAMYKRTFSRLDVRASAPAPWLEHIAPTRPPQS